MILRLGKHENNLAGYVAKSEVLDRIKSKEDEI